MPPYDKASQLDSAIFGRGMVHEYRFRQDTPATRDGARAKATVIRLIDLLEGWQNVRPYLALPYICPGFDDEAYVAFMDRVWRKNWTDNARRSSRVGKCLLVKSIREGVHRDHLVEWIKDHPQTIDVDDLRWAKLRLYDRPGLMLEQWLEILRANEKGDDLWPALGYDAGRSMPIGQTPRYLEAVEVWESQRHAVKMSQAYAELVAAKTSAKTSAEPSRPVEQPSFEFNPPAPNDFETRKDMGSKGELAFRTAMIHVAERARVSLLIRHVGLPGDGRGVKADLTRPGSSLGVAMSCRISCPDFLIQVSGDPAADVEIEVKTRSRWHPNGPGLNEAEYDTLRLWAAHSPKEILVVFVCIDGRMCWVPFRALPTVPSNEWHSVGWEYARNITDIIDHICPEQVVPSAREV